MKKDNLEAWLVRGVPYKGCTVPFNAVIWTKTGQETAIKTFRTIYGDEKESLDIVECIPIIVTKADEVTDEDVRPVASGTLAVS
jgi:hypothetical protein